MTYVITGPSGWAGVADHPDEAEDFAIRMAGADRSGVTWGPGGSMMSNDIPTGWKIGVMK